jgi:hypothetical protein
MVVFYGPPVSSINKTDRHDIAEILLKVALNTISITYNQLISWIKNHIQHWNIIITSMKMSHTIYAANGKVSHIDRRMCEWDYTTEKSLVCLPSAGLALPHCGACPKPTPGFTTSWYLMVFLCSVGWGERWLLVLLILF